MQPRHILFEGDIDDLDVTLAPELAVERLRIELDRPRLVFQFLCAPDAVQDDAQIPVAQTVAKKQKVAFASFAARRTGRRFDTSVRVR